VRSLESEDQYSVDVAASQRQNIRFYFKHYIDISSFPQSTHYVHIVDAVVFTNLIYHTFIQLGEYNDAINVGFSTTGSYVSDLSFLDMNQCSAGINQPCTIGAPCGSHSNHHKSVERISDALLNERDDDTSSRQFSVLWCDRAANTFCTYEFFYHERLSSFGVVDGSSPAILVLRLTGNISENTAAMSIILAHEVAHCLHMADVYGSDNHENDGIHECLMDYLEYDDTTGIIFLYEQMRLRPSDAFCDNCQRYIYQNILLHFYYD
jgi:hypothetical protein